jgi:hypothetical protein
MQLPYTEEFHDKLTIGSLRSAHEIVPVVMDLIQPKRVVDIGCSLGVWLSVFQKNGAEEILGIDGDYVNLKMLNIPPECFIAYDLEKPFQLNRYFDLVVSLEVAEHLSSERAESFIDTLVSLGPVVLFSAAVPYQPGDFHVNCQWPDYWAKIFSKKGYILFDCLRMKFWQNKNVEWWYAQNMFLFVRQDCIENYPLLKQKETTAPFPIIHPGLYLLQQHKVQKLYQLLLEYEKKNQIRQKE